MEVKSASVLLPLLGADASVYICVAVVSAPSGGGHGT